MIRSSVPTSHGFQPRQTTADNVQNPQALANNDTEFEELHRWVATIDQTPYLCLPRAVSFRNEVCGGEDMIRNYCFDLARNGGELVAKVLGTEVMQNSTQTLNQCCFTNVRLPLAFSSRTSPKSGQLHPMFDPKHGPTISKWIMEHSMIDHNTWIPGKFYNGAAWVRLSAQIYLDMEDFARAAEILSDLCLKARSRSWDLK